MFDLPDDAAPCSRFADMIVKGSVLVADYGCSFPDSQLTNCTHPGFATGTRDAITDGTYQMVVDMSNFNAVVPSHPSDRCDILLSRVSL